VERKSEETNLIKLFKNTQEGERYVGKPGKKWLNDAENDSKKMGVKRLEKNS
jgi:hypothetical protein